MNQPEFTTIHCGKLVSIKLEKSEDANITNIQADVYEHTGQIFNKLRVIQSKVKGSWNILCVDKAICNKTGVVQVCVLLQNTKSSRYLNLLTLQHLRTFQTVFTYKHIETLSAVRPCNIHIAHGPSVVLYNPTVKCILYFYLTENKQIKIASEAAANVRFMVSQSFDKVQAQFDFLAFKNPEQSATDLKLVNQEKEILMKENDSGWFKLSFVREFSGETRIFEEKSNLIPDTHCSVITAYFQMENKGEVLYITNKQQLVLSRNGNIIKSCAIPLSSCKRIYMVGSDDRAIAVTHDLNNSACCLVRLSTFQILETWTNISAVAFGPLPILNSVQMCVVMLKMPSGLEQIGRN
uniref:Uncharacterized protein n=1 Tax=Ciona savignyi TaxID=51511 RepID=H2ZIR6_CIOSA